MVNTTGRAGAKPQELKHLGGLLEIRDVSLFVEVAGNGEPLVVMHGGPGADHYTMLAFRALADQFTVVLYDHRCNGQSTRAPISTMTWENLTADADALRERLGFERWAVLGHSFGGHVALEYALRYPSHISHLVLMDTGADCRWARENAPQVALQRGFPPEKAELVRRWFHGETDPHRMFFDLMSLGPLYSPNSNLWSLVRDLARGEWRGLLHLNGDAVVFAGRTLLENWSVMDRLTEISAPTLVIAGRQDFIFPPDATTELASHIPNARLRVIDGAGHNPQSDKPAEVIDAVRQFISEPR